MIDADSLKEGARKRIKNVSDANDKNLLTGGQYILAEFFDMESGERVPQGERRLHMINISAIEVLRGRAEKAVVAHLHHGIVQKCAGSE